MPSERITAARKPCPCGAGQVRVDITYKDSDWGMTDHGWEGVIECESCAPLYDFIGSGRGVDLIRIEDKQRRDNLLRDAVDCENACFRSDEVSRAIEKLAAELDALPNMTAKHRLAVQLGIETATLPTFRKHTRNVPARQWLSSTFRDEYDARRSLHRLRPVFKHFGMDSHLIERCCAEAEALREQAFKTPQPIMSLGPISMAAALSGGRGLPT
jgi:hypothetical protein